MPLNLANEICTPGVDENPGLRVCPPSLIANGVRVDARCWSCGVQARCEEHREMTMVERAGTYDYSNVLWRTWLYRTRGFLRARVGPVRNVHLELR